jgi:hypothetical protein
MVSYIGLAFFVRGKAIGWALHRVNTIANWAGYPAFSPKSLRLF